MVNDDGLTFVALSLALVRIVYPSRCRLYWCCPLTYFNGVGAGVFVSISYLFIVVLAISDIVVAAVHVLLISVLMVVIIFLIVFGYVCNVIKDHFIVVLAVSGIVVVAVHVFLISVLIVVLIFFIVSGYIVCVIGESMFLSTLWLYVLSMSMPLLLLMLSPMELLEMLCILINIDFISNLHWHDN